MPGFNRKGPLGEGPMTGRKMGRCTNFGEKLKNQIIVSSNSFRNEVSNNENNLSETFGKDMRRRHRFGNCNGNGFGKGFGFGRRFGQGKNSDVQ